MANKTYKWTRQQSKYENTVYLVLWGMLFIAPLLSHYIRSVNDSTLTFNWTEVLIVWKQFAIYLLLFIIHNYILAPMLVYRQKKLLYFSLTAAMLVSFALYQCHTRPDNLTQRPHDIKQHHPALHEQRPQGPPHDGDFFDHEPPPRPDKRGLMKGKHEPPPLVGQHDIVAVVILFLLLGMNLGIKYYFKSQGDRKKLLALEKENLEQQLEYLKYQINPHFFMNTLNNIHALVDIDPTKAQETILELSKMMRFVLYEGNKKGVPLTKELDFICTYIQLMKLRYTDKVKITVNLPQQVPDRQIPPLMLVTFIENAFKHGISYQHESFIDILVDIEHNRLRFMCCNSKADKPNQEKGGVGLVNVKQRLNLLYDNNYTLNIQDEADIYQVELEIPLA